MSQQDPIDEQHSEVVKQVEKAKAVIENPSSILQDRSKVAEALQALSLTGGMIDQIIRMLYDKFPEEIENYFKDEGSIPLIHKTSLHENREAEQIIDKIGLGGNRPATTKKVNKPKIEVHDTILNIISSFDAIREVKDLPVEKQIFHRSEIVNLGGDEREVVGLIQSLPKLTADSINEWKNVMAQHTLLIEKVPEDKRCNYGSLLRIYHSLMEKASTTIDGRKLDREQKLVDTFKRKREKLEKEYDLPDGWQNDPETYPFEATKLQEYEKELSRKKNQLDSPAKKWGLSKYIGESLKSWVE